MGKNKFDEAFNRVAEQTSCPPTPPTFAKQSLDPNRRTAEQENNRTATTGGEVAEIKPPRKQVKARLNNRKRGVVQTERFSFEITPELHEKLNKRLAEIQLATGKKVSASELIRQALARELREV